MESFTHRKIFIALLAAYGVAVTAPFPTRAEVANLSDVPLANSSSDAVRPNLMYILDDSGSMSWDFMPDNIHDGPGAGGAKQNCKSCAASSCAIASTMCSDSPASGTGKSTFGDVPYFAAQFNQIYYNPDVSFPAAVSATGVSLGNASPTAAMDDAYLNAGTFKDLTVNYPDIYYCNVSGLSSGSASFANAAICRRNGINNLAVDNQFLYWPTQLTGNAGATPRVYQGGFPNSSSGLAATNFRFRYVRNTGNPYYFRITPHEYCSDANLINCNLANTDGTAPAGFTFPAPVRYCSGTANAAATGAISDAAGSTTPRCRKKFDTSKYIFPRYGRFTRVDIVPGTPTHTKSATAVRPDCAGATTCTHAEELQNFANWYSYYRTRMMMMKTATGRAYLPVDDRYRVGFITINPGNPVQSSRYLPLAQFAGTQKNDFYTKLYGTGFNGSTPLREALSRVGRHYAGVNTGINLGMPEDPMTHSCQQNFALLTTDGYYNDSSTVALGTGAGTVGNQDNVNQSGAVTCPSPAVAGTCANRATGTYDGALAGASNTLADVAMYYYRNDLRTSGPVSENNVPTAGKDIALHQHMVTFTLGLGLLGLMDYVTDYESNSASDFAKIKAGTVGVCSWIAGACNWPVPVSSSPSTLDDLWHAAVNGRGSFYSAADPNSLADGLAGALSALKVQTAAASASATSSPNITETDNFIYSSTFRTVKWDGEITAQRIDTTTGNILPAVVWSAQAMLDGNVGATTDTRAIHRFDPGTASKLNSFAWANLSAAPSGGIAAEQPYFENKCGSIVPPVVPSLSQCALLNPGQQSAASSGQNMVEFLRGRTQNEGTVYRDREHVLGDPVNATPAFVKAPSFGFQDPPAGSYAVFKAALSAPSATARPGVLYIAANDGMLHAFNGDTGVELWTYVPRIVFPNLYKLATDNWDTGHQYSVDGSPQPMDVFDSTAGAWKTILIGGLGKGGRGFYALDVTDPASPKGLWEICSDSTLCLINDPDLGYSFGNAVTTKRASDGKWVAIIGSGINNVSPGTGRGYLYVLDVFTGAILSKVDTGVGDITTPSGLSKISAFANNFNIDNTATYVYGGDLLGNVWRFNMSVDPPTILNIAQLKDGSTPPKPQSITTRPELGVIGGNRIVFVGTGRYLGEDDLVDPATLALQWSYTQSFYAIKDRDVNHGNFRASGPGPVQQSIIDSGGITRTTSSNTVDWTLKDGWYVDFNPGNTSPGERVNLDPILVLGTVIIVTNVPNNNACTVGGDSWIYQLGYDKGAYVASAPGQVAGSRITGKITVGMVVIRLPSGVLKGVGTTATGEKLPFGVNIGGTGGTARRVSWRELLLQ